MSCPLRAHDSLKTRERSVSSINQLRVSLPHISQYENENTEFHRQEQGVLHDKLVAARGANRSRILSRIDRETTKAQARPQKRTDEKNKRLISCGLPLATNSLRAYPPSPLLPFFVASYPSPLCHALNKTSTLPDADTNATWSQHPSTGYKLTSNIPSLPSPSPPASLYPFPPSCPLSDKSASPSADRKEALGLAFSLPTPLPSSPTRAPASLLMFPSLVTSPPPPPAKMLSSALSSESMEKPPPVSPLSKMLLPPPRPPAAADAAQEPGCPARGVGCIGHV